MTADQDSDDSRVEELLEQILESGDSPEDVCHECPELLPDLRAALHRLRQFEDEVSALFPPSDEGDAPPPEFLNPDQLPDVSGYEVLGILGHGGMGIVFRARHLRLNRPVALKMILAGTFALPAQRQRFLREAEAVAAISHPNIVQVYNAGESEGRPWFTMELVEGGSLARKINGTPQPAETAAALVASIAEAVAVAHRHGIVHRDLTPANILLTADGTPKVSDFGLARWRDDVGPTLTGSPLGTPSYMSPEQARGDSREIGPATDIYALGANLYELVTGRPPFRAGSATATLQQVLTDEPVSPTRLNPQVPRDAATICLKCLHKDPGKRYASAAALAEDLRRFLRGEPIAARRAGPPERLARWARRHPAAAALVVVTLLMAATVLGGAGWLVGRQILTARAVEADLREAERLQQQSAFPEAGAALERARSRLGDSGPFWLYPALDAARRDHQFLVRLEAIRLNRSTLVEAQQYHADLLRFNKARADRDYAEAFRAQGMGEPADDPEGAAARVRAFKWAAHLVSALDDWAVCAADPARQDWVLAVARRADPDPWRDRVRDPTVWRDGKALAELARAGPPAEQPVPLLLALGERLSATGEDGVGYLRRVREQHPEDFWANFTLALAMHAAERRPGGDPAPALAYYQKSLAIGPPAVAAGNVYGGAQGRAATGGMAVRPRAVAVLNDLGVVLFDKAWMWEKDREGAPGAINVFYQVMKTDPHFAAGFANLGAALKARGDWPIAAILYNDAVGIDPRLAPAHVSLAEMLAGSGSFDEAIDHCRQALSADPDLARAHHYLGLALVAKGRRDEVDECYPQSVKPLGPARRQALNDALAHYWQAFLCDPEWAPDRNVLRIPAPDEARLKEAIDHYLQAVRLDPQFDLAHAALGQALLARHEFTEAEAEIRRSIDLLPEAQKQHRANLGRLLERCQKLRALEDRLPAVVQGKEKPDAADCLDLADLCFVKKHYATAARLYAEALASTPGLTEDLRAGHRFNAARAAALAGGGHGDDVAGLGEPALAGLREQARDWLRLDLAAWAKRVDTGTEVDRIHARKTLAPWRDDPDLAGLRDAQALERLPDAERQECRSLWQGVADLLRRAEIGG